MNATGFWRDKEPCWAMLDCSPYVRQKCAAFQQPEKPCWEHLETRCAELVGVRDCPHCKVFARYGAA